MVSFAHALPRLRRRLAQDLSGSEPSRERVLACSVRLLDIGLFRIGGGEYAERGGGLGLTTIHKRHVTIESRTALFDYPAKGGVRRVQSVEDPVCVELIRRLRRRRGGGDQLLAYRDGRAWVPVRAEDVNEYLKERLGEEFSAKDFRTWNATVLGAAALAANVSGPRHQDGATARDQASGGCCRRTARQHACRCPACLHRPADLRPVSVGLDDRPSARRRCRARRLESPGTAPSGARGGRSARR